MGILYPAKSAIYATSSTCLCVKGVFFMCKIWMAKISLNRDLRGIMRLCEIDLSIKMQTYFNAYSSTKKRPSKI
jgi:hypothetical protein